MDARRTSARFAAPAAFLVAATIAVLLVRSALSDEQVTPQPSTTIATTTQGTTTGGSTGTSTIPGGERRFYEIQAGDTLETIAAEHETTVEQLLVLNPDIDPVALSIGQRIRVE
ncbi:MAG TPA: LysM domain-containing protein [Gaiellaceae bacterium]|nr:LysM domain-containing protein [Gaiellaceae bacterium]